MCCNANCCLLILGLLFQLVYGDITVDPGLVLTPTQVQNVPSVMWKAEDSEFYTLIMNGIHIIIY